MTHYVRYFLRIDLERRPKINHHKYTWLGYIDVDDICCI